MKILKKILVIVPVICGIMVFMYMKKNKEVPLRLEAKERIRTVRVIPVEKMDVIPRATGYGYVEPVQTWEAICEVSGEVVEVHEHLKKGYFINKGERLLHIDTAAYGLAESRGKADVMNVDAQLRELEQSRKNTHRLLAIEKRSLNIAAQELERKRGLFKKGYVSESELEKEEKNFLAQQSKVNNLQNTLNLFPTKRKALLARKDSGELTLTERQLDVAKTEITAPFDCRLSQVNVELNQYAAAGSLLLKVESIHSVEIPVQLTPVAFMNLLPKMKRPFMQVELNMETIRRAIGITAEVRLPMQKNKITWQGHFSRTSESMDLTTGAITIYVTVDEPYGNAIPGKRPPLLTNMYMEVELRGRVMPDRYVIPTSAVHEGRVYIAGKDNRLKIRKVNIAYQMQDISVLEQTLEAEESEEREVSVRPGSGEEDASLFEGAPGLFEGATDELLVISDLVPAIEGMLLNPVPDNDAARRIRIQASGKKIENPSSGEGI